jgi:hypothetical protein
MSSTIDIATVTDSISKLTITGVTIKDIDQIPSAIGAGTALLVPRPKDFVTNFRVEYTDVTKQNMNVFYTLNYVYYHCALGNDIFAAYPAMLTNMALIIKAFADDAKLTGAVDHNAGVVGPIGGVQDMAGNWFHGFVISKEIMQFLEV